MTTAKTILIVDDEEFVRESLIAILEAEGWQVIAASNCKKAMTQLEKAHIDVVISDLSMPDGDGLELLRWTKENGYQIPVVLLTGVGKVSDAVLAIKAGAFVILDSHAAGN